MKTTKIFSAVTLVLLLLVLTTFTYAYWAGDLNVNAASANGQTLTIGSGENVKTLIKVTDVADTTKLLVPVDRVVNENQVSSYTYNYKVNWYDADDATVGSLEKTDLIVTPVLTITNSGLTAEQILEMFTVTVNEGKAIPITLSGDQVNVSVVLTFKNEPASKAIYDKVVNGKLNLALTFAVNPEAPTE